MSYWRATGVTLLYYKLITVLINEKRVKILTLKASFEMLIEQASNNNNDDDLYAGNDISSD